MDLAPRVGIVWGCGLLVALLLSMELSGCQSVSEADAQKVALQFVKERGKFYSTSENQTSIVQEYGTDIIDSSRMGTDWGVTVRVSSASGNATKQALLRVIVDGSSGAVKSLNPIQ